MNNRYLLLILSLIFNFFSEATYGQRIIKGRILDEESIEPLPAVYIYTPDTILLGKTNLDGFFELPLSLNIDRVLISWVGFEWSTITIPDDCSYIELILMTDVIYDFMTSRKEGRLRKKRFDKIPKLHLEAFQKGLFKSKQPCYSREFIP